MVSNHLNDIPGDKGSRVADELTKLFENIEYTAVEPNRYLLKDFDFSTAHDPKYKGKVTFNVIQDTEQNYRQIIWVNIFVILFSNTFLICVKISSQ